MKKTFSVIVFSVLSLTCSAQQTPRYRDNIYLDLAFSASSNQFTAALSASHLSSPIRKIPNLQLGYGLRFTTFVGANQ